MQSALKNVPVEERAVPAGLVQFGDEYCYAENPPRTGVQSLDVGVRGTPAEEKQKDTVKNELF
jgi:penicillin-binding protein 1A